MPPFPFHSYSLLLPPTVLTLPIFGNQVIHNELDYRLPITEGLAAFNVLQTRGIPSKFLMFSDEAHVREPALSP